MTLTEFVDYCLSITAQTAGEEPTAVPVLDAGMVVEFLLPAVLREAVRENYKNKTNLQTLVKAYPFTLTRGLAALPVGFEEEFSDSFQLAKIGRKTLMTLTAAWDTDNEIVQVIGSDPFTGIDLIGYRVVFVDEDGVQQFDTLIADIITTATIEVYNVTGPGGVIVGTLYVQETQWVAEKTFDDVFMGVGSKTLGVNSGDSFVDEDEGNLVIVTKDGIDVVRGIVDVFVGAAQVDLTAAAPSNLAFASAVMYRLATDLEAEEGYYKPEKIDLFSHYPQYADFERETGDILPRFCVRDSRIYAKDSNDAEFENGTGLVFYGVFVPQVPATADGEILVGEQVMDDALAIASAVLKGTRTLNSIGLDEKQMTK